MNKYIEKFKKLINEDDEDIMWFFNRLNEEPPLKILEVGAWDEDLAHMLTEAGYDVIAIDLHPYDRAYKLNHKHIVGNFNTMNFDNEFDVVISTSTIEHFGLNVYGENIIDNEYDLLAVKNIWKALKLNGMFYVTVPFGFKFYISMNNWKIYNINELKRRIIQNFKIEIKDYFMSGNASYDNKHYNKGQYLTEAEALSYYSDVPHLTVGLKLRKEFQQD